MNILTNIKVDNWLYLKKKALKAKSCRIHMTVPKRHAKVLEVFESGFS